MNWLKVVSFCFSGILAICLIFLSKIEKPLLVTIVIVLILISTGIAIFLEYQDSEEVKTKDQNAEKWRKQASESLNKIDEQHEVIMKKEKRITVLEEEIEKLDHNISEVNKKAEPNKISLLSKNIEEKGEGYKITLKFKPTKNEPLGQIVLVAKLEKLSKAKILNFWPSTAGGAFQSGKDSKQISDDGYSARLIYSLMGAGYPVVELTISAQTSILIEGNHGLGKFIINIE